MPDITPPDAEVIHERVVDGIPVYLLRRDGRLGVLIIGHDGPVSPAVLEAEVLWQGRTLQETVEMKIITDPWWGYTNKVRAYVKRLARRHDPYG